MATLPPFGAPGDSASGDDRGGSHPTWSIFPTSEVLATVATAPVPDIPLADLREALVPQFDDAGRLVDWFITMPPVPGGDTLARYWAWRRNWATFWPVGSLGNLGNLLDRFSSGSLPLAPTLVRVLRQLTSSDDDIVVGRAETDALLVELVALRRALGAATETGLAIIDDMPGKRRTIGIARAFAPSTADVVLAATDSLSVHLRPGEGMVVRQQQADAIGPTPDFVRLHSVDMRRSPVVVVNEDGARRTVAPFDARPLAWLLPRSLAWHIEPIPLIDVWDLLLGRLPIAIAAAAEAHRPVRFTTLSPIVGSIL